MVSSIPGQGELLPHHKLPVFSLVFVWRDGFGTNSICYVSNTENSKAGFDSH
jgi:hypothetical protein